MRILLALISVAWLLPSPGLCGEKPALVLFGLEDPHGVLDWKVRNRLTDRLAELIGECGHPVIPPSEIQERLKNRFPPGRFPHKRTTIARSLGAWATLVTRIQQIGGGCRLDAFLYSLKSDSAEKQTRKKATCDERALLEALPALAEPLCQYLKTVKIEPKRPKPEKIEKSGAGLDEAADVLAQVADQGAPGAQVETRVIGPGKAAGPARVSIVTDPQGADVRWDGKLVGKSPIRIDPVEPGWHRLVLAAPGCVTMKESLKVAGSIEMKVSLFLDHRKVRVLTNPPGAEISVDGEQKGRSPLEITLKAKQPHRLVARKQHHRDAFYEFKPKPATKTAPPQEVKIELDAQPVYVLVDVSPPEARVEIGAGKKKEHIIGSGTVGIIPGRRKVIAWLEGYVTVEKEVDFPAGKSSDLRLRLNPIPGYTDTKSTIRSKRIQAFATLELSVVALSAVWPMLKWSSDSQRASDEWLATSQQEQDPQKAQEALGKSHDMADRAEWTEIAGYAALGVGVVSLGWSLYSFISCPKEPQSFSVAPAWLPGGGQVVVVGRFW